jgi:predicted porin
MKKSLIVLGTLSTFAAASVYAQSSVTLFGVVDATLAHGTGSLSNKTQLTNSGNFSSRLGFRGIEDLGSGMSASFWLEAGVNNDDGQGAATNSNNQASGTGAAVAGRQGLTFNRRSTVSLAGGWGEVRLGRDYTPQFGNMTFNDPFGTVGVGANQVINSAVGVIGATAVRASNSIGYLLPNELGGFYGQVMYYLGENNSNVANNKDGDGMGARFGFAKGQFDIAIALSKTKYLAGDVSQNNVGGSWDFGVAKLMGQYEWDKSDALVGGTKAKGYLVGAVAPVGVGRIRMSYSRYRIDQATAALNAPTTKKFALGYVHNLSKRTALYATYAHLSNTGGATQALNGATTSPSGSSSGYDLGITHFF